MINIHVGRLKYLNIPVSFPENLEAILKTAKSAPADREQATTLTKWGNCHFRNKAKILPHRDPMQNLTM